MTAIVQRSFAGGEIAPALYARTDQVKYATGARTIRNMIVQRHGGVANRPGTAFIAESKNSAVACRLIPFVLDATDIADTYVLEFGNGYVRFYQDGGQVVVSGVSAWANTTIYAVGALASFGGTNYYCRTAHTAVTGTNKPGVDAAWQTYWHALTGTIYEIPTPYQTADLDDLRYVQSGDVITIVHKGYAPRELTRSGHTNWALSTIVFRPAIEPPTNIAATGAGAAGTVYYAVTSIKEGTLEESLVATYTFTKVPTGSNPNTLTWNPAAGAISYNVYRATDGTTFGLLSSSGGLPGSASDTSWTDSNETASSSDATVWTPSVGQMRNALSVSATARAFDGKYTVNYTAQISGDIGAVGAISGRVKIYYSRGGEARVLAATTDLFIQDGEGAQSAVDMATVIDVPDNGYTTLTIDVVPEVIGALGGGTGSMAVDASAKAITWVGNLAGFVDAGESPDYTIGPPANRALFLTPDDYPSSVMLYQQRRVFAGSVNEPEKAWASRIGSYANFCISTPLQADDAVTFSVAGRRVNAIKHMLELGRLVLFGSGGGSVVNGDDAGSLRPDAVNPSKLNANGVAAVAPVEVDDSAVYVHRSGRTVLDLKPIGLDGYQGNDLTIMAAHLFEAASIVDIAYQQTPNSIVWAVRDDGALLGLTYIKDQAVWGWHRHDTDGDVEHICVVPEHDEDALYLVVKRTIDGDTKRYVERLTARYVAAIEDAVFMDAALSYDGWHTGAVTMTLSGGTDWTSEEQLVLTRSVAGFTADDAGNAVFLVDANDNLVRCTIEQYVSTTVVKVRSDRTVPASMQAVAVGNGAGEWALAVDEVSGLDHLEGCDVSILADGYVVASPNNSAYTARTVASGAVSLDRPYAVIHVGLPYLSDLETLDLDSPGPRTWKDKKMLVNRVGLFIEKSRGVWLGRPDKATDDEPLAGLQQLKQRSTEDYDDPTDLLTDSVEVQIDGNWNNNGRVLVRQPDPLPLTVLSVYPIGFNG